MTKTTSSKRLAERLIDPASVLAITGLVAYVMLRAAYLRFYGEFGLAPDDLGLGYVELLTQSATALVVPIAYGLPLLALYVVFTRSRGNTRPPADAAGRPRSWLTLAPVLLLIVVGAGGFLVVHPASQDAQAVVAGNAVRPSKLLGVRLTSWGAEAATLSWTTNKISPTLRPLAHSCLMYLGESDNTLFVYSPHALGRRTFLIPAALAVVRIAPSRSCRRGSSNPSL
jgi:hypothetical protein